MITLSVFNVGHVTEFVNEEIENLQTKVAKEHGFKIIEHSLIIYADSIKKPCDCKKKYIIYPKISLA